jgi:hypothetical protein
MNNVESPVASLIETFTTRLDTLEHLLDAGARHLGAADFLQRRLIADMHPLGTQVAYTCNQPRNFALWMQGQPTSDLDPVVASLDVARERIHGAKALLAGIPQGAGLPARKDLRLGTELRADLSGHEYVHDFLLPNFYFHLVTAYDILRMSGVAVGKGDYMRHLGGRLVRA